MRSWSRLATSLSCSRMRASSPACSSVAVLALRRVEAGVEQCGQIAGEPRIGAQGLLDIGLAERRADLQDVAAVGAQGDDLARAQPGGEHQAVEAVILQPAGPDAARTGPGSDSRTASTSTGAADRRLQAEIVQPSSRWPSAASIWLGSSLSTLRPMFSSTGSASESSTGWSRRISLKRSSSAGSSSRR